MWQFRLEEILCLIANPGCWLECQCTWQNKKGLFLILLFDHGISMIKQSLYNPCVLEVYITKLFYKCMRHSTIDILTAWITSMEMKTTKDNVQLTIKLGNDILISYKIGALFTEWEFCLVILIFVMSYEKSYSETLWSKVKSSCKVIKKFDDLIMCQLK